MRKSKLITTLEAPGILLVFLLAGCGGGGGDAPGTATATTPANTPATAAGPSTPGVPVTPDAPTMALSITNTSPATYQWGVLTEGQELYVDRTYVFTSVPATHQSLDYLKTANDDKTASGMPFVSFDVNTPVTVYVAYHTQIATRRGCSPGMTPGTCGREPTAICAFLPGHSPREASLSAATKWAAACTASPFVSRRAAPWPSAVRPRPARPRA
ncbi:MAG: hypothetical protein ACE5F8_08545 [Woeseiaceae bacterium]